MSGIQVIYDENIPSCCLHINNPFVFYFEPDNKTVLSYLHFPDDQIEIKGDFSDYAEFFKDVLVDCLHIAICVENKPADRLGVFSVLLEVIRRLVQDYNWAAELEHLDVDELEITVASDI